MSRVDERGAGTLLTLAAIAVVVVLTVALVVITTYLAVAHRARGAADLAALSAAVRVPDGGDACAAAERVAGRNNVAVTDCVVAGDRVEWAVEVHVAAELPELLPGLPDQVPAVARAGSASLAE